MGAKAANFSELLNTRTTLGGVNVPEAHFAIPFYYYSQHLKKHGIDLTISNFLNNENINAKPKLRKQRLKAIRDTIIICEMANGLGQKVNQKMSENSDFESFRFRSSTNAEDIKGFSGAGLYNSFTAKKGSNTETVALAIKKVWASLWNWRAFEERSYYKIDHKTCFMGILVHRSFPDEDANGVVLTTNLYNSNPGFIVNAQYQNYSIVYPKPGILHDQIMVYTWNISRWKKYTIEYLSFSNIDKLKGKTVMHDKELERLMDYCMAIKQHYYYRIKHNCDCA
ncbi:MAG: PEP/pyruvate-binding domain-containing protein, partial [Bacteroidia bacterium]